MKRSQGSALFLILIAVALFASLGYAISQSGRGGGNVSREKTELAASQLMSYMGVMQRAINNVRLIGGCTEAQISFEATGLPVSYANASAPASFGCHIFRPEGGSVTVQPAPADAVNSSYSASSYYRQWWYSGGYAVYALGTGFCGTPELIMGLAYVSKDVCLRINERNDVANPGGDAPIVNGAIALIGAPYAGSYAGGGQCFGFDDTALQRKPIGCFKVAGSGGGMPQGSYTVYAALIEK